MTTKIVLAGFVAVALAQSAFNLARDQLLPQSWQETIQGAR